MRRICNAVTAAFLTGIMIILAAVLPGPAGTSAYAAGAGTGQAGPGAGPAGAAAGQAGPGAGQAGKYSPFNGLRINL